MVDWILGKLKWLFIAAALAGPVFAVVGWTEIDRVNTIVSKGVDGTATIVTATRKKGRRGGTSYEADLAWKDAKGTNRTADDVRVSHNMASRLFRDDRIVNDQVRIKYLADEPGKSGLVLADDIQGELELDRMMMYGGPIVGLIGLLGAAWMFGLFGKLRSGRTDVASRSGRQPGSTA